MQQGGGRVSLWTDFTLKKRTRQRRRSERGKGKEDGDYLQGGWKRKRPFVREAKKREKKNPRCEGRSQIGNDRSWFYMTPPLWEGLGL